MQQLTMPIMQLMWYDVCFMIKGVYHIPKNSIIHFYDVYYDVRIVMKEP